MKPLSRLTTTILISILLIIGQFGCAHTPKVEPPTLSEETKAQLGTIGVVSASFQPAFLAEKPMTKKKAAVASSRAGALGCLGVGVSILGAIPASGDPLSGLLVGVVGLGAIALTPVGAAVGGIVGAVRGVNETTTDDAESVLNIALNDFDIQGTLRDRLLSIVQEKTSYPVILLEEKGPSFPGEEVSYRLGTQPEVDTTFELSILQFALSSSSGGPGINPPLSLFLMAKVRAVRVSDNQVLYTYTFSSENKEKKKFTHWAENHGQPLKDGLDQCLDSLASQIVTTVFGLQGG